MRTAIAAALVAILGLTTAANAVDITWNVNANGNWGTAGNWDLGVPTGADNAILGAVNTLNGRLVTVDTNQTIDKLTVLYGSRYELIGGAVLTLLSGDMYTMHTSNKVDLGLITLQVGDGVTAVTDAVWDMNNDGSINTNEIGAVKGIAGTSVTITGANQHTWFSATSNDYHGDFVLAKGLVGTKYTSITYITASNAMGDGTVTVRSDVKSAIQFNGAMPATGSNYPLTTHAMTLQLDGLTGIAVGPWFGNTSLTTPATAKLTGALTGSADVTLGSLGDVTGSSSTFKNGVLVLESLVNTYSGTFTVYESELQVDGDWTGAGNILVGVQYAAAVGTSALTGSGTIGMAEGKYVSIKAPSGSGPYSGRLAPGTDASPYDPGNGFGTIGTLTIGTEGNNNEVRLDQYSKLKIDLSSDTEGLSDRLVINGVLNVLTGKSGQELYLNDNGLFSLNGVYTLATFDSMTGDQFDEVYFNGSLVANPTLPGGVNGTHQLIYNADSIVLDGPGTAIPEPGTLLLLGTGLIGALGIIRRRKLG